MASRSASPPKSPSKAPKKPVKSRRTWILVALFGAIAIAAAVFYLRPRRPLRKTTPAISLQEPALRTIADCVAAAWQLSRSVACREVRAITAARGSHVYMAIRDDGRKLHDEWFLENGRLSNMRDRIEAARRSLGDSEASGVDAFELVFTHSYRDKGDLSPGDNVLVNIERGILGVEFKAQDKLVRISPTQMIASNRDSTQELKRFAAETGADPIATRVFRAEQILVELPPDLADAGNARVTRMVRGNRNVQLEEVTSAGVDRLARLELQWLERNLHPDGRMTYLYKPSQGGEPRGADNTIRQWMATVALEQGAKHFGRDDLWPRIEQNIDHNLRTYYREYGQDATIEWQGDGKLGAMSLAALAIALHPNRTKWQRQEERLRATIESLWHEDGSFTTFYKPKTRGGMENFYPGETLVYWAELLSQHSTPNRDALGRKFKQSFRFYREWHLEERNRNPAFVPWHTQAYYQEWRRTRDSEYRDFIFEMNDWLLGVQEWKARPRYPDVQGRFYDPDRPFGPPHASSTGVYIEGLADAYALAKQLGDTQRAEKYRVSIIRATRSIMQLQYVDNIDMFYITERDRVQGGIRTNPYDNEIRCDNVQHSMMGFLKLLARWQPNEFQS